MIYIVDDDKSVRRSFELLLHSAGLESKSYAGAKEFLDEYKHNETDLLILDIHMPDIDGCELLNILKNKNIIIPVIVITAFDKQESRKCAKDYGVIDYLLKPIDGDIIIELIMNNINNSSKVF
jgi:FixJ family two-component response regulator